MTGKYFWVRITEGGDWEPAKDDGGGFFLIIGSEMPGKPAEIGPEIEVPHGRAS